MRKDVAAIIAALLLIIQVATLSLVQAPLIPELSESIPEDSSTSARNNTSCGTDSNLTDLMAWTDATTYIYGTTVYATYLVNCSVNGETYNLQATVADGAGWSSTSNWNWTETDATETMSESWSNLSVGNYCINATLIDIGVGFIDLEYPCFTITNATSGGGGGNTTNDCGNNSNLTDLMAWTDETTYTVGDTVHVQWVTNCTVIGNNYTIDTFIHDGNSVVYGGNTWFGWTAQWNPMHFNDYISTFPVGNYCMNATLYESGSFVDYEDACFTITNSTSGGGGGNNTGNNSNCLGDGTLAGLHTELFIWTDDNEYIEGETTVGTFFINCTIIGENYNLTYWIENDTGDIVDSGWWNFTATQNSWSMTVNWWLPAHINYQLTADLHGGTPDMGWQHIAHGNWAPIDVFANNTTPGGGNNTGNNTNPGGGNNTGNTSNCGNWDNMTQLWATEYFAPYYVWESIQTVWITQCAVVGHDYMLHAFLEDSPPSQILWEDWENFTATTPTVVIGNAQFSGLSVGDYCINSTLYDISFVSSGVYVDHVESCFTVIDWWNNTNNNNNTTNNTGNNSSNPIMPNNSTGNNSGNNTGFNFTFDTTWGQSVFIDPYVAIGYDYEISAGPNFASVQIPYNYGDGVYDIYLWNGTDYVYSGISITTGTTYQFQSGGVDRFSIRGIEVDAELNPDDPEAFVTGLTFVTSGEVDMAMTPLTVFVDEPTDEPDPVGGCTDLRANNYDEAAEEDDGSCTYDDEPEPCTDDCPELISGDDDGDGVPNEWDDCEDTPEGELTDSNGCEVIVAGDPIEDDEGGMIPGFGVLAALGALSLIAVFRPKRN